MHLIFLKTVLTFLLLQLSTSQDPPLVPTAPQNTVAPAKMSTLETLDKKLTDAEKRLYSIEDKIDHLLYHHSHDVTPHHIQFSMMGPVMVPEINDPKSAHTQMKTHDILRGGMSNPFAPVDPYMMYSPMTMGGFGNYGGYGDYPPIY